MACWTGEGWRLMDGRCCARTRGRNHPDGIDAAWSGRPPGGRGLRCSSCRSPCPVLPCKWGQRGAGQAHAGSGRQGHLHRRRMPPSSDSRIRAVFIHRRCSCPQAGDGAAIEIRALLIDRACSGVPVDEGRGSGIRAAPIHRSCSGHPMCGRVLTARWRAWAAKSPCCVCTGAWGKAPCRALRPTRGRGDKRKRGPAFSGSLHFPVGVALSRCLAAGLRRGGCRQLCAVGCRLAGGAGRSAQGR